MQNAFCVSLKRANETENISSNTPGKEEKKKKRREKKRKLFKERKLRSLETDTEASDDELSEAKKKRLETISGFVNNQNK